MSGNSSESSVNGSIKGEICLQNKASWAATRRVRPVSQEWAWTGASQPVPLPQGGAVGWALHRNEPSFDILIPSPRPPVAPIASRGPGLWKEGQHTSKTPSEAELRLTPLTSGLGGAGASVRTECAPPRPARRQGWLGSRGSPRCSRWTGRSWVRSLPALLWAGARPGPPQAQGPHRRLGTPGWRGGAGGQGGSAGQLEMGAQRRGCQGAARGTDRDRPGLRAPAGSCLGLLRAGPRPGWALPGCCRGRWQGPFRPWTDHLQWQWRELLGAHTPRPLSQLSTSPAGVTCPHVTQQCSPRLLCCCNLWVPSARPPPPLRCSAQTLRVAEKWQDPHRIIPGQE